MGRDVAFTRTAIAGMVTAVALVMAQTPATAQTAAPYDDKLGRLAEVLGSIHYLRNLCAEPSNRWRDEMERLLSAEKPEPVRRARLIAAFNKGYRSFDSVYARCTEQARTAADRYVTEGRTLALDLANTYGPQ
ncbi:MAG: TIGR02301 family protein [Roseitalea porphyridii]|jgi:uncharacterized protein (TIGR02301 family)|uniref:TIGR02301 family protein n=2 Tax=Roseitalea porphyridii TaxID=1852022 RepID=UPI0032D936DF